MGGKAEAKKKSDLHVLYVKNPENCFVQNTFIVCATKYALQKKKSLFIFALCLVFVLLKSLKLLEFIFSHSLNLTLEESTDADLKFRHLVLFERAQRIPLVIAAVF